MKRITTAKRRLTVGFKGISTRTDESILDFAYSPRTYNYTFRGGVLKSDLGLIQAAGYYLTSEVLRHNYPNMPEGVKMKNVFIYRRRTNDEYDDRLIAQSTAGGLYYTKIFSVDTWHQIEGIVFLGNACAVNYNVNGDDLLLLSSPLSNMIIINGDTCRTVAEAPRFSSLAVHYERVYGTVNGDNCQVWFSDQMNPDSWKSEGAAAGYITFQDDCGDVLSVVSFLNYLYIFREHGIYRLTAYGDMTEFSLKKLFTDTGRIYKNTIAPCGDKIFFFAEEGFFSFDGYDVVPIMAEAPDIYNKHTAIAAYHENKYYIACHLRLGEFFEDPCINSAVIEYDIREKTISILAPIDVQALVPCNVHQATDMLMLTSQGLLGMVYDKGRVFGKVTNKLYESPESDLGTDKIKMVRNVTINTKVSLSLHVTVDGEETTYSVKGGLKPTTVFVGRSGHKIKFALESTADTTHIAPLIVSVELF